jgi:hypothetical protein
VPWSNGNIYWDTAGCCDGGTQRINADANDFGQDWTEWNHYVFIKSGDYKEIWINGELFLDGENTGALPTNINKLWIGAGGNGGNSLRGKMDDFAVFASTLDEDQILSIYEGGTDLYPAKRDISALDVTVDLTPPSISVVRNADGTVTVTFDGTLQTAPTVNGPWSDVDGNSPLTIPSSDAAAFGRAKK